MMLANKNEVFEFAMHLRSKGRPLATISLWCTGANSLKPKDLVACVKSKELPKVFVEVGWYERSVKWYEAAQGKFPDTFLAKSTWLPTSPRNSAMRQTLRRLLFRWWSKSIDWLPNKRKRLWIPRRMKGKHENKLHSTCWMNTSDSMVAGTLYGKQRSGNRKRSRPPNSYNKYCIAASICEFSKLSK